MKKAGGLFAVSASWAVFAVLILLSQLCLASAIDLTITKKEISSLAIIELNKPAIFEFTIENNEPEGSSFQLYSLVGVVMKPSESFYLDGNATKTFNVEVYPRNVPGYFSFEYKIKNSAGEVQTDELAINIANLKTAFGVSAEDIGPEATKAVVYFENRGGHSFDNIFAQFSSVFFNEAKTFSLAPNERKALEFELNQEKMREILAGPYLMNTKINVEGKNADITSLVRFTEQAGVSTQETTEGWLLRRYEITKTNNGNVASDVEIIIKKNFFSGLITTFNLNPTNKDTIGLKTFYVFAAKLAPGEKISVIAKTNWWILVLVIAGIAAIAYFARRHAFRKLVLLKRVTFVKTKGGEFALKISLVAKAREFIEKIKITDRLPNMVKLYERYGTIAPDKIDEKNRRIEWNTENMNKGEERVFSYIIYSKIGVVGRFELPEAEAVYEYIGEIRRATSNRAFFVNEPGAKHAQIKKYVQV